MRVLGTVLAGGRSSRFGSDKALAELGGVPLIERTLTMLRALTADAVVCGRDYPGVRSLADWPGPGLGPLGGLAAALRDGRERGFEAVLSCPCDIAEVPPDLVAALGSPGPAYVAAAPVIGLWPCALADRLFAFVATDSRRSMRGWAAAAGARPVELALGLTNINTPDDLAKAEQRMRGAGEPSAAPERFEQQQLDPLARS